MEIYEHIGKANEGLHVYWNRDMEGENLCMGMKASGIESFKKEDEK